MKREHIIQDLIERLSWNPFFSELERSGFTRVSTIEPFENIKAIKVKDSIHNGNVMLVNDPIQAGSIRDASFLHISPHVLFRPKDDHQLKNIIKTARKYEIPISLAGGKTGLSGGYANFGITIDLSVLSINKPSISLNFKKKTILVNQNVLISDLIKYVPKWTRSKLIFPIQPSSSFKLPVQVGGIISSNASGITSGKLGGIKDWLLRMQVMKPDGTVVDIERGEPLFNKIIGGNGYYGIILSAEFQLHKVEINLKQKVIFGSDIDSAFQGLQSVLDAKIFPLISEFAIAPKNIPGKFRKLMDYVPLKNDLKWLVLLKGTSNEVESFTRKMQKETKCSEMILTDDEFQMLLQERTSIALLSLTDDNLMNYVAFPGFEDILSEPSRIPKILQRINQILIARGFHEVLFGYGHLNFRKGEGILLHLRLPVPVEYLYKNKNKNSEIISSTIYEVLQTLKNDFKIKYKAEHGSGPFQIWLESSYRQKLRSEMRTGITFFNPHILLFNKLIEEKFPDYKGRIDFFENRRDERLEKELFILAMSLYLSEF